MLEEIGYNGQLLLGRAKVCVVGSRGLGNPISVRLAAMGIGALRIIDRDTMELANLHRQFSLIRVVRSSQDHTGKETVSF